MPAAVKQNLFVVKRSVSIYIEYVWRVKLQDWPARLACTGDCELCGPPPRDSDTYNRINIESTEICNNLLRDIGMCGILNRPNERR
jgi:hypothetical protein